MTTIAPRSGYAPNNGLGMHDEVDGEVVPLLPLHGAFVVVEARR